jgi:hypothetical protein
MGVVRLTTTYRSSSSRLPQPCLQLPWNHEHKLVVAIIMLQQATTTRKVQESHLMTMEEPSLLVPLWVAAIDPSAGKIYTYILPFHIMCVFFFPSCLSICVFFFLFELFLL